MEIRDNILRDVPLPGEPIVPKPGLHEDFSVFFAVDVVWFDALEEFNGALDAGLQLVEGGFFVVHVGDVGGAETLDAKFGGVGAGLDLVGKAVHVSL